MTFLFAVDSRATRSEKVLHVAPSVHAMDADATARDLPGRLFQKMVGSHFLLLL